MRRPIQRNVTDRSHFKKSINFLNSIEQAEISKTKPKNSALNQMANKHGTLKNAQDQLRLLNDLAGRVEILKINDSSDRNITVRNANVKYNGDRPSIGRIKNSLDKIAPGTTIND